MGNYVHICGRGTDIHEGGGDRHSKRGWDGYSLMVGLIFHLGGTEIRERGGGQKFMRGGGLKFMRGGTGIHERGGQNS